MSAWSPRVVPIANYSRELAQILEHSFEGLGEGPIGRTTRASWEEKLTNLIDKPKFVSSA